MEQQMPDSYGTGRQPKKGSSYAGLAVILIIVLLAAAALPFVIPMAQKETEPTQQEADGQTREPVFELQPEQQVQTAICGMLICELEQTQCRYWDLPNSLIVGQVEEGSSAEKAGILPGDVIVQIGDETPISAEDCARLLTAAVPDGTAKIELYRSGREIVVVLDMQKE